MQESFRWYGPNDQVPLSYIRQTGAKGVVSSLHHIPYGEVWTEEEILSYKKKIEDAGLIWNVVESLPVHEDIKVRSGRYLEYIENYKISLRNLGKCGVRVITYNFMPVLDWVRTDLHYKLPDGSEALFYNQKQFAAFEIFILQREGAEADYTPETVAKAKAYYDSMSAAERDALTRGIIDNFPGFKGVTLEDVRSMLARYKTMTREDLEANLRYFLSEVVPVAEEAGCIMVIHPDDPPRSILGLPRIFSNIDDVRNLLAMQDSPANGICFCSGSFSGRRDNNIVEMFKACAPRVGFLHMRSTQHDDEGNFFEANHLEGCVDMFELMKAVCEEQLRRKAEGRADWQIPMRPDHGHVMMDDLEKPACANPGYTAIGRMKGLAELRGLEFGVLKAYHPEILKEL
ncbi:MAG: mannonate dehydratase [Lentisphaeria bacterium]|nr:mannonate dehydratase [Lentisphaeria bacterium]